MKRKLSKGLVLGKRSIAILSNDTMSGIAGGSVYSSGCGGGSGGSGTVGCPSVGCPTVGCPTAGCVTSGCGSGGGSAPVYSCRC